MFFLILKMFEYVSLCHVMVLKGHTVNPGPVGIGSVKNGALGKSGLETLMG
jgi:hypothetical protein